MTHTPLTVAARRLDISLYTLRQWCKTAGIDLEEQKSKADTRQKWLTDEQLLQLAEEHGRLLDQEEEAPEPIPVHAYRLLIEQVAQVAKLGEEIRVDHATLQTEATQLHKQQEDAARLVAEIQQAGRSQEEQHQQVIGALQEEQQQIRTALGETDGRQQEHSQVLGQHTELLTRLQERASNLETNVQGQAERLGKLATTSEQHGQQLAGLTTRVDHQGEKLAQLETLVNELAGQIQTQAEQTEKRLRAEFQEALTALQQQMQSILEQQIGEAHAAIHKAERNRARDVAQLTEAQEKQAERIEQLDSRVTSAASGAEEAKRTAAGQQGRIFKVEQDLITFNGQFQAQTITVSTLEGRVARLETQETPVQGDGATQEKPASRRKMRKGTETEPGA